MTVPVPGMWSVLSNIWQAACLDHTETCFALLYLKSVAYLLGNYCLADDAAEMDDDEFKWL